MVGCNVKCISHHWSWKKRKYKSPILAQCQVLNECLLNGIIGLPFCIYFCLSELSPSFVATGRQRSYHLYYSDS